MRILLLADTYNSLTQRTHAELAYRCHQVSVELALSDEVMSEAVELYQPDYDQKLTLKNKKRLQDEQFKPLKDYRTEELEQIKVNLYGPDPSDHIARHQFVYKVTSSETPLHLAKHRQF